MWCSCGSGAHVVLATKFSTAVPNIFGSFVRNLLRGGSQAFGKICTAPCYGRAYEDRFLLDDINPDDGNSKILLNATTILPDYTVSHSKRHPSLRGSNPGGGETFPTRPDGLSGPPNHLHNGYRVFPGGKTADAWRWPPISIYARG